VNRADNPFAGDSLPEDAHVFVSVIVPCFRSTATLAELVERLDRAMPVCAAGHETVLVVDDGEAATWAVAAELARSRGTVRALQLARNYGQHNALIAGIRAARYEVIVTMDDDLQHLPEEVPALLRGLTQDVDLVYGVAGREEHGVGRSLASRTVKALLARALGVRHARDLSAFRAFRSFLTAGFDQISGPHASVDVALSWGTNRTAAVTVDMRPRETGTSGYTLRTLTRYTVNLLVGYSSLPLRLVTWTGFAVGLLGLGLFAQLVYRYATGATTVAGYTTIASMIAIFASVQLVALGVLGEYIGRIHSGGMGHPTYLIRASVEDVPDRAAGTGAPAAEGAADRPMALHARPPAD
jgi:undecaprenyl-phosphate 4-deoxy-4-formamido-L-arabinose transferase